MTIHHSDWVSTMIVGSLALLLTACGGSDPADTSASSSQSRSTAPTQDASIAEASSAQNARPDAELTAKTLAQAETLAQNADASQSLESLPPGSVAAKEAYLSGAIARKAEAIRIPAYRFYNASTGAHFYTISTAERDRVLADRSSPYSLEGTAFWVANVPSPGLSPVHRFFNTRTGVHFYTISEAERADVAANQRQFTYEGVAYYASQVAGQGFVPFYRFYAANKGVHFFTSNESERADIQANLGAIYRNEGIGYYVLNRDSSAPAPAPDPGNSPVTSEGWTNLHALINSPAYSGSRVVYVSSSQGNDLTGRVYRPDSTELGGRPLEPVGQIAPYSSLQAAWAQVRNGSADVMLLRRGDTWSASLSTNKLGTSASARIIVAAYGNPALERPQVGYLFPAVATTAGNQLLAHFVSAFPSNAEVITRGVTTRFEGVLFTSAPATVSPVFGLAVSGGLDLYRCGYSRVRLATFQEIGRANMKFWDNVMWHPVGYVGAGGFEHNNYFQFNTGDIDSRRNISANSPGVGFRQRGLGTLEANLVIGGNISSFDIGTNTYYGDGAPADRGTFLRFRYNLALHNPGAYALYDIKNAVIEQNIFLAEQYLTYFQNTGAVGNPLPLTNVTVQDNIFYGSYIVQAAGHSQAITGPYLIRRNDFQKPNGGALIQAQRNDLSYENNNRFWTSTAPYTWFAGYTSDIGAYVPSRGSNTRVAYPDPNRDLITYMRTLGVSPANAQQAIEWFVNGVPGQSALRGSINNRLGAWDPKFTSTAVINHVRAGFGLPAISDSATQQ